MTMSSLSSEQLRQQIRVAETTIAKPGKSEALSARRKKPGPGPMLVRYGS